jgi:adenylate cyclase
MLRLRPTVVTSFIAIILIVVGAVSYSNYRQGLSAAEQTASELIVKTERLTTENVGKLLLTSRLLVEAISELPASLLSTNSPERISELLRLYADKVPLTYSLYIGFSDGSFVQAINLKRPNGSLRRVTKFPNGSTSATRYIGPVSGSSERDQAWGFFDINNQRQDANEIDRRTSYDPRVRPWYERSIQEENIGSSSIYIFASLKEPGVTISMPMRNVPGAIVGLDIPLNSLADFVKAQQPGANGVIAVISEDGSVVAHPDADKIVNEDKKSRQLVTVSIHEIEDLLLRRAFDVLEENSRERVTFSYNEKGYVSSVAEISELPGGAWRVISVASIDDFTGAAKRALTSSLFIASAILLIALIVVTVLANWIAKPIKGASEFAKGLSQLNLDLPQPKSSPLHEIQSLSEAMVNMRGALNTFLKYAPKDLVQDLVTSGKSAEIGGRRQEVTLMFTDIADFTTISEKLSPEDVMNYMSIYFEQMGEAISEQNGVIDKFIGDAIMAMWNAPLLNSHHVSDACSAALRASRSSNELNAELAANNFPELWTRFGLHSCEALVGNIGAPDRMQYTSLGAGVNLASRIEGLNKFYKTQILVSDTVRTNAGERFLFRRIDLVTAKGTTRPVTVFELLGERDEQSDFYIGGDAIRRAVKYEQAFDFYLHRDFEDAVNILEGLNDSAPEDYVVEKLLERCRRFIVEPPDRKWDGSTALDEK